MTPPYVVTVGPAVPDTRFEPIEENDARSTKHDCTCRDALGGAAVNVATQIANLGVTVCPVLLVGNDPLRTVVEAMAREQFDDAVILPVLEETRRSALIEDDCYTVRSPIVDQSLPHDVRGLIEQSELTVLAPLSREDAAFAEAVIEASRKTILQLSKQQLGDRETALRLARSAWVTVLNQGELEFWSGYANPVRGIMWLREQGVHGVVVTDATGALAFVEEGWYYRPAFETTEVRVTIGAGDRFLGTLAACIISAEASWRRALDRALASAALHVEGDEAAGEKVALEAVIGDRDTVDFVPPEPSRSLRRPLIYAAAAACAVVIAVSLGWWL